MGKDLCLQYYYSDESEQYKFYRIPKILFTDIRFKNISTDAKLLYGLMIDRMSLSIKNGWLDNCDRAYIYFTLEEAMKYIRCGKDKGIKLFAELDTEKGYGLIERKRQGLGKPIRIYVKKFTSGNYIKTSENQKSGVLKNSGLEFEKSEPNNTDINNTDITKQSINLRETVCKNIEYDALILQYGKEMIDEIVCLILEIIYSNKKTIMISKEEISAELVKIRFLSLKQSHLEYVLNCLRENTTKVHNIKQYILTSLYNSYSTIACYYQAEVNHDLYGQ